MLALTVIVAQGIEISWDAQPTLLPQCSDQGLQLCRQLRQCYLIFFTHVPPAKKRDYLGAYHAAEIPYVFQNLDSVRTPYGDTDDRIAELMSAYWVSFAKTGNPNNGTHPNWQPYDTESEFYLNIGQTT